MTKNERYIEMAGYIDDDGLSYQEGGGWSYNVYGGNITEPHAYAIIEADIRKQLIAAGWSLTWVADNPGEKTYYAIDKITLTGAKHLNEFSDYAAALLYGIQMERELYGVKEGA